MIILLQRVLSASVRIEGTVVAQIDRGLLVFVGFQPDDSSVNLTAHWHRLLKYRVFADEQDKMNLSLFDITGDLLLVPQFTLAADTQRGLRPSFSSAAPPQLGIDLFNFSMDFLKKTYTGKIASGVFGANMQVSLINDGPVTFLLH